MDVSPEMLAAKDALATLLRQALPFLPGVAGVDIGFRQDGVELTDEVAIRVLVTDGDNVPSQLDALTADTPFPVTVVQRDFTPLADDTTYDPVIGGGTVKAEHGGFLSAGGTLGGIANDAMFGGRVGVSCAHVIASSTESVNIAQGDPIYQPGLNRKIGRLHRWQDVTDTAVFTFDDAIAFDGAIADIGAYSGMSRAALGDAVRKRGKRTLLTTGRVSAVGLQPLGIGTPPNSFEIYTDDVVNQPIFAESGDSGSLIVNLFDQVVGILTQKGIEYSKIVTIGTPPPGAISGFATQMMTEGSVTGAADSVGINF
ncbi:hypothetical protein [Streptomyces sp. NPDC017086]|uniref:hypothetical protein n=1 Tax=Streptomyces sp. NPDC017086 TaxID=3364976 RepID=UPI0037ABAEB4